MSRALASVPASPLDRLAREVRALHEAAERAFSSAVNDAHRAGQLLIEAKAQCAHGEWLPWLRDAGIPERSAQVYMRLARKYAAAADLPATITDALDSLEDRERRERRARRQELSAEFDRVMAPVRRPDSPWPAFGRSCYHAPYWTWSRLGVILRQFLEVEVPSAPPDQAEHLLKLIRWLLLALDPECERRR